MAKKKKKTKILCHNCTGLCCRYMALPIETPEDREDFDDIRWYLVHKGVSVFVEDGDWYLNIENRCKYLSAKDHRCKIYAKRPQICRDFPDNPLALLPSGCGYREWKDEVLVASMILHALIEILEFNIKKIEFALE